MLRHVIINASWENNVFGSQVNPSWNKRTVIANGGYFTINVEKSSPYNSQLNAHFINIYQQLLEIF